MSEHIGFMINPQALDNLGQQTGTSTTNKLSPFLASQINAAGVAEAVVILRDGAGLAAVEAAQDSIAMELSDAFVIDRQSPAQMIFRSLKPRATRAKNLARAGVIAIDDGGLAAAAGESKASLYTALGVMIGDVHAAGAAMLAADERVHYVASSVPFSLVRPIKQAAAKLTEKTTWGIDILEIPRLWDAGLDGNGVLVGHLDTGADGTHPALAGAIQDFLFVDAAGFPGSASKAHDTGTHGTHTAGAIAARPVLGRSVGVAPGAKLAVAAVIEGGDAAKRIITGLNWAVTQGVRIVSLSLGFRGYVHDLHAIMSRVRSRGILPVVAVGNDGPGTSRSPGNYDVVLSVGSCDSHKRVAGFSSSQRFAQPVARSVPDIVGPGVEVISATPGGGWLALSGTSMATPHIAGLAALLWQAKPNATLDEIEDAILRSASRGAMSEERAGRGLPNGPTAYELLTGTSLGQAPRKQALTRGARSKRTKAKRRAAATRRAAVMWTSRPKAKLAAKTSMKSDKKDPARKK